MNKLTSSVYMARTIILSSLMASAGFLSLPSPSRADREVLYRNCAELQKHLNDNNPGLTVKNFEKVQMMRRTVGYEKYMIFCNGGIVIDKRIGTICRGYIGYSFSRIGGGSDHYATWGKTNGLPNFNDVGADNYCRRI
jgi:hypothetical protein